MTHLFIVLDNIPFSRCAAYSVLFKLQQYRSDTKDKERQLKSYGNQKQYVILASSFLHGARNWKNMVRRIKGTEL
jgi:hypothetical protein